MHAQAFNVGMTSENYQIRELAEIVSQVVPGSRIKVASNATPDLRCYRVDCNKISRALHGYKPQWTARRGVEQLYKSYCEEGVTLEEFEGERFKRIAHVQRLVQEGRIDSNFRRLAKQSLAV